MLSDSLPQERYPAQHVESCCDNVPQIRNSEIIVAFFNMIVKKAGGNVPRGTFPPAFFTRLAPLPVFRLFSGTFSALDLSS